MNKRVEFNFSLHIPYVLKNYRIFDIGQDPNFNYFDEKKTGEIVNLFSKMSYLEVNRNLYNLLKIHNKKFKFSLTITGVSIEIMKKYNPILLESFKKLVSTGLVEFKSSFYHSLSVPITSKKEILEQIKEHENIIEETFKIKPTGFAKDFIDFNQYPINSGDVVKKILKNINSKEDKCVKLKFDYDFFGIKNDEKSGVFNFLKYLPTNFLKNNFEFEINNNELNKEIIFQNNVYKNNQMQTCIIKHLTRLEELIKNSGNKEFIKNWKRISSFDYISNLDSNSFTNNPKNNFLSHENHYELYIILKNIIEDMNLKLSNIENSFDFNNINQIENLEMAN